MELRIYGTPTGLFLRVVVSEHPGMIIGSYDRSVRTQEWRQESLTQEC